jgi:hypothetical protein
MIIAFAAAGEMHLHLRVGTRAPFSSSQGGRRALLTLDDHHLRQVVCSALRLLSYVSCYSSILLC